MIRKIVLIHLLAAYMTAEAQSIDVNQIKLQFQHATPEIRNIRARSMLNDYYKLQQTQPAEAIAYLKEIITIFPEFKLAQLELLNALEKQGNIIDAYHYALMATKQFPDDELIALSLANYESILGNESSSFSTLNKLSDSTSNSVATLAKKYLEKAKHRPIEIQANIDKYYEMHDQNNTASTAYLDNLIKQYPLNYQLELVKELSSKNSKKNTDGITGSQASTSGYQTAMNDYYLTKKTDKTLATKQLKDIIQNYPNEYEPYLEMGYTLLDGQHDQDALPYFLNAKKILTFNKLQNSTASQSPAENGTTAEPSYQKAMNDYYLTKKTDKILALQQLNNILKTYPNNYEPNLEMGYFLLDNQQNQAALPYFQTAKKLLTLKALQNSIPSPPKPSVTVSNEPCLTCLDNNDGIKKLENALTWGKETTQQRPELRLAYSSLLENTKNMRVMLDGIYNAEKRPLLISYIRILTLNGNYQKASVLLSDYLTQYGKDIPYLTEEARLMALTNQSQQALILTNSLLEKDPKNQVYLDIKKYALAHANSSPIKLVNREDEDAKQAADQGDYEKAIPLYHQTLMKNPNDKDAVIGLEFALAMQGDYAEASVELAIYKNKFGEDEQYLTEKARLLALTNQQKEALDLTNNLLQKNPKDTNIIGIKKYALSHANSITSMTKNSEFKEISDADYQATMTMQSGNYLKAIQQFRDAINKDPNDKYAALGLASAQMNSATYPAALQQLTAYKNKFSEDDAYLRELARYYAFTNEPQKAILTLKPLLQKDPTNDDLLDIQAYAQSHSAAATAAKNGQAGTVAAAISPAVLAKNAEMQAKSKGNNPKLFIKASEMYMSAENYNKAMEMVNSALKLDPTNGNYIYLKAKIASAKGDTATAYREYKSLFVGRNRNVPQILLAFARAAGEEGRLDESARLYVAYLKKVPKDSTAWLELAYIQSWRGNDRKAVKVLNEYQKIFGKTTPYLIARARVIASAQRPKEALALVDALLPTHKDNYDLAYAQTTAYYYNNQPYDTFKGLARVNKIQPKTPETKGLNAFINTPYRSNVGLDLYHSFDTDTVYISRATASSQYFLSPVTSLLANVTPEVIRATVGSGLSPVQGGTTLDLTNYNVGINHRFNPHLAVQGLAGGSNVSDGRGAFIYQGDAFVYVNEVLQGGLQFKRSYYDQSPEAVSLGIVQNLNQIGLLWQPCLQCYLALNSSYSTFTDTNSMGDVDGSLQMQVVSSEVVNIKLGVAGQWQGFAKPYSFHGYYSPLNYRFYGFISDFYFKQTDNIGYEFSVGLGAQKDETFLTFKPANDFSGKAYFGIYQDWYLTLAAGMSTRGRSIAKNPTLGTYRVTAFEAALTRRF